MREIQERIYRDKEYSITITPELDPSSEAAVKKPVPGADAFPEVLQDSGFMQIRMYDAGARVDQAGRSENDQWNVLRTSHVETSINPTFNQLYTIQQALINTSTVNDDKYLYSERPLYSHAWPMPATDEVTGYLLGFDFRSVVTPQLTSILTKHLEVIHSASYVNKMRSGSQLVTDMANIAPFIDESSAASFEAARNTAENVQLEQFDGLSAARLQKDLTLNARLQPGFWQIGVTCPYNYHPWNFWSGDYKVTELPVSGAPSIDYKFPVGKMQSPDVRVFLVPQRQRILFQWYALYILVLPFASPILTFSGNTGTYEDRLPIDYRFTSTADTAVNDDAMSRWISESARYNLAIAQDRGLQFFSPWASLILVGRVEGRWTTRQSNLHAGDLAAIVDYHVSGQVKRAYVWRTTDLIRSNTLIDFGPLFTDDVTPMSRSGVPAYNFSGPYGPV